MSEPKKVRRPRCRALLAEDIDAHGIPARTRYCMLSESHGTDHKDRHGFWWSGMMHGVTKRDRLHHAWWNGTPIDFKTLKFTPCPCGCNAQRKVATRSAA